MMSKSHEKQLREIIRTFNEGRPSPSRNDAKKFDSVPDDHSGPKTFGEIDDRDI